MNIKKLIIVILSLVVLFVVMIFSREFNNLGIVYVSLFLIYMLKYNKLRKEKL